MAGPAAGPAAGRARSPAPHAAAAASAAPSHGHDGALPPPAHERRPSQQIGLTAAAERRRRCCCPAARSLAQTRFPPPRTRRRPRRPSCCLLARRSVAIPRPRRGARTAPRAERRRDWPDRPNPTAQLLWPNDKGVAGRRVEQQATIVDDRLMLPKQPPSRLVGVVGSVDPEGMDMAARAALAPLVPCAHASMSAIPSIFSRRCCCVCAELSGMAQSSF